MLEPYLHLVIVAVMTPATTMLLAKQIPAQRKFGVAAMLIGTLLLSGLIVGRLFFFYMGITQSVLDRPFTLSLALGVIIFGVVTYFRAPRSGAL